MASQCQHIMATGVRCATPPVKSHRFCYHHRRMHDTYSLPGDSNYKPEALDSPQAITITLHHLDLAMNKGRMTVREFRARLFLVQLAIANLKRAADVPPSDTVLTQYTPAMRDLHHLNPNQPCETAKTVCERCHSDMPVADTSTNLTSQSNSLLSSHPARSSGFSRANFPSPKTIAASGIRSPRKS
jgi:hypothetical protein